MSSAFPGTRIDGYMAFFANTLVGLVFTAIGVCAIVMTAKTKPEIWPLTGVIGLIGIAGGCYSLFVGIRNLKARVIAWRARASVLPHEN